MLSSDLQARVYVVNNHQSDQGYFQLGNPHKNGATSKNAGGYAQKGRQLVPRDQEEGCT